MVLLHDHSPLYAEICIYYIDQIHSGAIKPAPLLSPWRIAEQFKTLQVWQKWRVDNIHVLGPLLLIGPLVCGLMCVLAAANRFGDFFEG
jgi:hypothetical protein